LLAEIGYRDVTLSRTFGIVRDEAEKWIAVFAGSGLPECEVLVDTRSIVNKFLVEQTFYPSAGLATSTFANLSDPFDLESADHRLDRIDRRVPILSQLCRSLYEEGTKQYECYDAATKLWWLTEEKTNFEVMSVSS